eukprot:scaffold38946_cov41-Tisochrysis_lutea.AAC.3
MWLDAVCSIPLLDFDLRRQLAINIAGCMIIMSLPYNRGSVIPVTHYGGVMWRSALWIVSAENESGRLND